MKFTSTFNEAHKKIIASFTKYNQNKFFMKYFQQIFLHS